MANRNSEAKYLTIPLCMRNYNMSRKNITDLAIQAGAMIQIGRIFRIDTDKFDRFLSENYTLRV